MLSLSIVTALAESCGVEGSLHMGESHGRGAKYKTKCIRMQLIASISSPFSVGPERPLIKRSRQSPLPLAALITLALLVIN